jgi:bacillithiol biosynthesis deacetylase BshB1
MQTPAEPLDVLVIAPHPDDAEISVGGVILACLADGLRVGILDLTDGEPTPHGTPELRAAETEAATRVLGVDWRANLGLPNRSLQNTLEARRELAGAIRLTRPRILLAPYWDDAHPDHTVASRLADDARFWAKLSRTDFPGEPHHPRHIFYYWSIHLRIHPKPAFVVDVSAHIEQKLDAVRCYASQVAGRRDESEVGDRRSEVGKEEPSIAGPTSDLRPPTSVLRFPTVLDDIRDRARYWGWTIGTRYAEPLASREEIGLPGLKIFAR